MRKLMLGVSALALATVGSGGAMAQSGGALSKAVGGYTFEDAVKEAPGTKDFHSKDGKLTFAIITHTAGNGFFDPTYVGAKLAADLVGVNLLMLGSEAPVDDIPRQLEILNQVVQDPTIDGLILTTPQAGAYDDIVKGLLDKGIPVATTNSFDGTIYNRSAISHTGQDATRRRDRRRGAGQVRAGERRQGRLDHLPEHHHARQCRGQQPDHRRLHRRPWRRWRSPASWATSRSTPARRTSASTSTPTTPRARSSA